MAEMSDFNRVMEAIKNSPIHTKDDYLRIATPEERFTELMKLYAAMCSFSGLITSYENLEEKKPEEVRSPLWISNLQEYIEDVLEEREEYHDVTVHSMSIFVANKIKDECNKNIYDMFDYFLGIRKVDEETYMKRNGEILEEGERGKIYNRLLRYLAPSSEKDIDTANALCNYIKGYGFTEAEIENVKRCCGTDVKRLYSLRQHALYIKDIEINQAIPLLEQEGISYGKIETDARGNTESKQPLLVIDLPYYGQFSVHMGGERSRTTMSQKNIEKMRNKKYELSLYEDRTVLLSDAPSVEAEEIDSLEHEKLSRMARSNYRPNRRFAHYAALKLGATKKDLYKIYGLKLQEIEVSDEDKNNGENNSGDGR